MSGYATIASSVVKERATVTGSAQIWGPNAVISGCAYLNSGTYNTSYVGPCSPTIFDPIVSSMWAP